MATKKKKKIIKEEKQYSELEFFQKYCKDFPNENILHFMNFLQTNRESYDKEMNIYSDFRTPLENLVKSNKYNDVDIHQIINEWSDYFKKDEEYIEDVEDIGYTYYNYNNNSTKYHSGKKTEVIKNFEKIYYVDDLIDCINLRYKHGNLGTHKNENIEHSNFTLLDVAAILNKNVNISQLGEEEIIRECIGDNKSFFIEYKKHLLNTETLNKIYWFEEKGLKLKALKNIYLATEIDATDSELVWFKYAKKINKENLQDESFKELWCVNFLECYSKTSGYKKVESVLKELVEMTESIGLLDEINKYIPTRLLKRDKYLIEISDTVLVLHPRIYNEKLTDKSFLKEVLEDFTRQYISATYDIVKSQKPKYYSTSLHEDINAIEILMNENNNSIFINTSNKESKDDILKGIEKLLPLILANKKTKSNQEAKDNLRNGIDIIIQYLLMNNQIDKKLENNPIKKSMKI